MNEKMTAKPKHLSMSETEITALKEALYAQQDLLQKLYCELDVEREAASSAASEALSMILRLQGEKAAIKMEANQYKRLAEEKMCHTEEALAIFEDLIYEKEMEIVSLVDEMGMEKDLRRNSLPPSLFKIPVSKKGSLKRERSLSPDFVLATEENKNNKNETFSQILDAEDDPENLPEGDINSYWEQIKKLDERVKEISDIKEDKSRNSPLGPSKDHRCKSPPIENTEISSEMGKRLNLSVSCNVHDVFEVPRVQEREASTKLRLAKAKSVSQMAGKPYGEDDNDLLRKIYSNKKREKMFTGGMENHSRVQRRMSEIVEGPVGNYRERSGEELKLLKEIQQQLNTIHYEIKNLRSEKQSPSYELELVSLSEAMLHFWL